MDCSEVNKLDYFYLPLIILISLTIAFGIKSVLAILVLIILSLTLALFFPNHMIFFWISLSIHTYTVYDKIFILIKINGINIIYIDWKC